MQPATVTAALKLVARLDKVETLALHNFGEPLLHPKFDEIALEFSKLTAVTVSTNAVLLDEAWADRLAKVPWAWISLSPWDKRSVARAARLLTERSIIIAEPPGITHNWAGQAQGPSGRIFKGCPFLNEAKAVIRWDGELASCCISDRDTDKLGSIFDDVTPLMRSYSLCTNCHHAL